MILILVGSASRTFIEIVGKWYAMLLSLIKERFGRVFYFSCKGYYQCANVAKIEPNGLLVWLYTYGLELSIYT